MTSPGTILIVDDENEARLLLNMVLRGKGYHLAFAGNGLEALAEARRLLPDLILLDVMMPDMNGFDLCQQLRTDPLLGQVPIIIVTALTDSKSRLQGLTAGADDFLTKPVDLTELHVRVSNTIQLNRYRRLLIERAKFEWVVENSDEGYVTLDRDGHLLYANPQARLYFSLPADSGTPIADTFQDLVKKTYRCEPQAAWANWPEAADQPRYLVQPESPTAHACWLQVDQLNLPSNLEMEPVFRIRNVTTRMNLQVDMRSFHTMINHKLGTLIFQVMSGLELMIEIFPEMPAEATRYAQLALRSAERLRKGYKDILTYLDAPRLAHSGSGFDITKIKPVITQVSTTLGIPAVVFQGVDNLNGVMTALSPEAIELILWEILENTVKFHPTHSPQVEISVALTVDEAISLKVCDDGITLSSDQLARVWTPYYQGEKYFTGEVEGMGLGLSAVFLIVTNAGGTCRIYNREGRPGVVVELVLPRLKTRKQLKNSYILT